MLAASALVMVILGAGVCFLFLGQDGSESEEQDVTAEPPIEEDDELTFVTMDDLLEDGRPVSDREHDDVFAEGFDETILSPTDAQDISFESDAEIDGETEDTEPVAEGVGARELADEELEDPSEEDMFPENLLSGGPGDTLAGTSGIDRFEIYLGDTDDAPTTIENFFSYELAPGETDPTNTEAMLERLWFRDQDGAMLSRKELLEENFVIEENEEINGVSLLFEARQAIHITNITLAEFTENSLIIGNYGVQAA